MRARDGRGDVQGQQESGRPRLSVVIAAFNAEATLDAQLDALQRQVMPVSWEVLVCDNGSTDGTAAVARDRARTMPEVRVVDASLTRGPAAARNVGAREARSPLLVFCDADDVVADEWLPLMFAALIEHEFVTGTSRRRELNSRPDEPTYFDWSLYRMPFFPYLDGAGAGNMGIHKQIFDALGGFDERLRTGEDLDLCWRAQLAGHRLVASERAVVHVSNREGLRASMRQAYAYGVGDKMLAHKFALVAEALRDRSEVRTDAVDEKAGTDATSSGPAGEGGGPSLIRRVVSKIGRIRRVSDLTEVSTKVATELGFRFGRIDKAAPQVEPPI